MRTLLTSTFVVVWAVTAHAQFTVITPTPTPDNDVVRISTNLIQVDVTVTDRKGKPVTDLRPEEMVIYENGKKQDISNFTFVAGPQSPVNKSDKKNLTAGPELPPAPVRPENIHRTIAIVVDDLTMSFESIWRAREGVKKFVREQMQDGDLVAILRTGAGIGALQQFTTDKRLLLAAAEKIHFNMSGGAKIGVFNPIAPTFDEGINGTQGATRDRSSSMARQDKLDSEVNDLRQSIFVSGTLGAVNYIVRGMKELPGRKSISLISDGIPLYLGNRGDVMGWDALDSLRQLTDLANRASVVIYTIDARGLVYPGITAEDNVTGLNTQQFEARLTDRRNELFDTQEGLYYLADQTGGFAVVNQNGINRGLQRMLDDQSYYLVGFQPDEETFDPRKHRFNKLEVKVLRKDVKVRYRSGFYAIADDEVARVSRSASSPQQALLDALTSPFSVNDVSLRLSALYMTDEHRAGQLRSFLHIDAHGLTFVKDDTSGKYKTTFDLVSYTFGDNGVPVEGERGTYSVTLSEDGYQLMMRHGLVYDFVFPMKRAGAYQLRVAIRDTVTNKTGSASQFVEAPNLKKDRLAMSGVMLANVDVEDMPKIRGLTPDAALKVINPKSDTAIRQFRPGSFLSYETTVYNAKTSPSGGANLTVQAKVFNDRQIIFEGQPAKLEQTPLPTGDLPWQGSLQLGSGLVPGNYTLQLIITDDNRSGSKKSVVQFVPFEMVAK